MSGHFKIFGMQLCKRPFFVKNYEEFPHFPSFFCKDFFFARQICFHGKLIARCRASLAEPFSTSHSLRFQPVCHFHRIAWFPHLQQYFTFKSKPFCELIIIKNSCVPSPQILPPELNSRNNRLWKVLFVGLGFALMCCIVLIWVCIIKLLWVWSD